MTTRKHAVLPDNQDTALHPYSPAIACGDLVFVSGQGPLDVETMRFVLGDIEQQVQLTLDNVRRVLEAAGCTLDDCVKVQVHLRDIGDFERFNRVYEKNFSKPYPARTTVQSGLAAGIAVEIDAVAVRGCGSTKNGRT